MKVEVGGEAKWICACGLSRNQPFCDGSHNALKTSEEGGALCWYDAGGARHAAPDAFPDVRGW